MRVLDLFCGMGGASAGYAMAGLDIVAGIDMSPSQLSRYPFDGHLMDWRDGLEKYAAEADLISASPHARATRQSPPRTPGPSTPTSWRTSARLSGPPASRT